MFDIDTMKKLGWSDALIDAFREVANPMRERVPQSEAASTIKTLSSSSSSALYSDAVSNNTSRAVIVRTAPEESPKK